MQNFPFKTLIWAVVTIIALFLFREGLEHLIFKMEEVVLFDQVSVKVNKADSEALAKAEEAFDKKVAEYDKKALRQDSVVLKLTTLTAELAKKVGDCKTAKATSEKIQEEVDHIKTANDEMKLTAKEIKDMRVFKRANRDGNKKD